MAKMWHQNTAAQNRVGGCFALCRTPCGVLVAARGNGGVRGASRSKWWQWVAEKRLEKSPESGAVTMA